MASTYPIFLALSTSFAQVWSLAVLENGSGMHIFGCILYSVRIGGRLCFPNTNYIRLRKTAPSYGNTVRKRGQ